MHLKYNSLFFVFVLVKQQYLNTYFSHVWLLFAKQPTAFITGVIILLTFHHHSPSQGSCLSLHRIILQDLKPRTCMYILVWLKCKNVSNSKYMDVTLILIQWLFLLNIFTIDNCTESFQSYYHKLMLKHFLLKKKKKKKKRLYITWR